MLKDIRMRAARGARALVAWALVLTLGLGLLVAVGAAYVILRLVFRDRLRPSAAPVDITPTLPLRRLMNVRLTPDDADRLRGRWKQRDCI